MINPELEFELEILDLSNAAPTGVSGGFTRAFSVRWMVPEGLSYFEGHFPGFPVLPGVATIDVTLEALRRALKRPAIRLFKLQNAKFSQPVQPGNRVEICLRPLAQENSWKAEWKVLADEPLLVAELALRIALDR